MIIFSHEIAKDNDNKRIKALNKAINKKVIPCHYRVFITCKDKGKAKGYWQDKGILYKDNIQFKYYNTYNKALNKANEILNNTNEICIAIENIKDNKLYIIYRNNKHEILKVKYTYKTLNKRDIINKGKEYLNKYNGYTIEYIKGYYTITSYK
jgi:hypothetical protein